MLLLDEKAVELINKLLAKGMDIEIQNRDKGLAILSETKEFICTVKKSA